MLRVLIALADGRLMSRWWTLLYSWRALSCSCASSSAIVLPFWHTLQRSGRSRRSRSLWGYVIVTIQYYCKARCGLGDTSVDVQIVLAANPALAVNYPRNGGQGIRCGVQTTRTLITVERFQGPIAAAMLRDDACMELEGETINRAVYYT